MSQPQRGDIIIEKREQQKKAPAGRYKKMGNNDILIGLNNIAPMELKKLVNQSFYYDIAPMEQMKSDKLSPSGATS